MNVMMEEEAAALQENQLTNVVLARMKGFCWLFFGVLCCMDASSSLRTSQVKNLLDNCRFVQEMDHALRVVIVKILHMRL